MDAIARKTPLHVWIVGALSLLWNSFGAYDYTQTHLGSLAYIQSMMGDIGVPPEQVLAYFQGYPAWATALWACGVWGALLGSALLLLRSRFAFDAFAVSLAGLAGSTVYQLAAGVPEWLAGATNTGVHIAIWSAAIFLLIYALSLRRKGVLR